MSYDATTIANVNCLHYWPMSETMGTTLVDNKGGLDGTLAGGVLINQPGFVDGEACMFFDGVNDEITFGSNYIVPASGPYSWDCWFKCSTFGGTVVQVSGNDGITPNIDSGSLYITALGEADFTRPDSLNHVIVGPVELDTWTYFIGGYDASLITHGSLCVALNNGGIGGSGAMGPPTGLFSKLGNGINGFFHGYIQKLGSYNVSCTSHFSVAVACPQVPCLGGTLSVLVTPSNNNTIVYAVSAGWLHVSGPVSGIGTATITADSNAGGSVRVGYVTIGDKQFAVQQLGGC